MGGPSRHAGHRPLSLHPGRQPLTWQLHSPGQRSTAGAPPPRCRPHLSFPESGVGTRGGRGPEDGGARSRGTHLPRTRSLLASGRREGGASGSPGS